MASHLLPPFTLRFRFVCVWVGGPGSGWVPGSVEGYSFAPGPEKSVCDQRKLKHRVAGTRATLTTAPNFHEYCRALEELH